jgi:L-seryl-tRNA(Ser) seleniumtransferase
MPNEIVIHRAHRINYDLMYRVGGGRLVEIGMPFETARWELERAIGERTAAVAYHDSPNCSSGALDFATVVEIAHARGVPVIVDSASTLPPVDHLRRWIRWGADLVIYSGGKGIRGPQDSGILAGRKNLIEAARLNGNPHASIGRGMKVSKEAMVGLWVALDHFLTADHEADYRARLARAETLAAQIGERADVRCEVEADWDAWPAPIVRIFPRASRWQPAAIRDALTRGDPPIHINAERGGLMVSTHCLMPGDVEVIVDRLHALLDGVANLPEQNGKTGASPR